jgi:hypothetical protein
MRGRWWGGNFAPPNSIRQCRRGRGGYVDSHALWRRKCEVQVNEIWGSGIESDRDTDLLELLDGTLVDTTALVDQMAGLWR